MVKWVCQIVMPVYHRALVFDTRLFAGNAADDVLVAGSTFRFCRLVCLCVKRRSIILNGKRRSLLNSTLFRADSHTAQKTISPFSQALIFTFDFAAFPECRSCPEDRSRRFVLLGALDAALRRRTYPIRTVMQFSRFSNMARDFWTRHRLSKEKPLSSPTSEGKGGERPCRRGESRTRRTRRTSSPNA